MIELRLKKALATATLSILPATIIFGFVLGFDAAEWLLAWTLTSIVTFVAAMLTVGLFQCPRERQKGEPRQGRKGSKL